MPSKAEILKTIRDLGFPEKEVAISLDDFFNNPYCADSIGVNIYPDPPAAGKFYEIFKGLLSSGKADNIYVRITDTEEPEDWFFTDAIYVMGSLSIEELEAAIEELCPDEILEEWMYGKPVNVDEVREGQNIYSVWWD